jgi:hypothetical protein
MTMNKYNLIISCGSASPAINEGTEDGLLRHNKKNAIHNYYPERKHQSGRIEFTDFVNMIKRYKTIKNLVFINADFE